MTNNIWNIWLVGNLYHGVLFLETHGSICMLSPRMTSERWGAMCTAYSCDYLHGPDHFSFHCGWVLVDIKMILRVVLSTVVLIVKQKLQYIPRNMHTVFALLCFVVVIHWLISPYPSGLLHWHCGNLTIAPEPAKQPWWIWINTSCEFIMNDCITTTKQSTTKPCAYFLGYTVLLRTVSPRVRRFN